MDPEKNSKYQSAHKHFSTSCFNLAWEYIDRETLTPQDAEEMVQLCLTSLWHWKQREDCTPKNLSIAYWQAARVFTLCKNTDLANHYAQRCLEISKELTEDPFLLGYACEAMARVASLVQDLPHVDEYLAQGMECAEKITDLQDKQQLVKDLSSVKPSSRAI